MGRLKELQQVKKQKMAMVEESHIHALQELLRNLVARKTGVCFCMPDYDIHDLLPIMARDSGMLQDDMLCLIFPDGEIYMAHWNDIHNLFDIRIQMVDSLDLKQMSLPLSRGKSDMLEQLYERLEKDEFVTKEDIFEALV